MSFRLFIYYSALTGAWAAFLAFAVVMLLGVRGYSPAVLKALVIGGVVGLFVAVAVGTVDAWLNATGLGRVPRVLLGGVVGLFGGLVGGVVGTGLVVLGQGLAPAWLLIAVGWALTGTAIGASVGVYDVAQARSRGKGVRGAVRKVVIGAVGGLVGGVVGGVPFALLDGMGTFARTSLAVGLVLLGGCVGLMIGLAQVAFREAWVKVEAGFKAGRELPLTKEETTIGRGEACDLGLFGDGKIEKVHARIKYDGDRYVLEDADTPAGTYLNDERLGREPAVLRDGDVIALGDCVVRFGTRRKRAVAPRRSRR